MGDKLDVLIPTLKPLSEIRQQIAEIQCTAGVAVRIIATCSSGSAAANRNLGLEHAQGEIVVMVDDDVTGFPDGWARDMMDVMDSHPECVMLSARLMRPDGQPGIMVGRPPLKASGLHVVSKRELPTACVTIRNDGTRFDKNFLGSGFEDNAFCRQLWQRYPEGTFLVTEDVRVVHKNEKKLQQKHWKANQEYFLNKWGQNGR